MIIRHVFIMTGLFVATILGIYGQSISYFLNEYLSEIKPITFLTILTFASIALYIMIPVVIFLKRLPQKMFSFYFILFGMIGIPTSLWSIFVWAMWMG